VRSARSIQLGRAIRQAKTKAIQTGKAYGVYASSNPRAAIMYSALPFGSVDWQLLAIATGQIG
jgi:hypothetical protein